MTDVSCTTVSAGKSKTPGERKEGIHETVVTHRENRLLLWVQKSHAHVRAFSKQWIAKTDMSR